MRLITIFELATRSKTELHVLFRLTIESAARGEPNSEVQKNDLATIEHMRRVLASIKF